MWLSEVGSGRVGWGAVVWGRVRSGGGRWVRGGRGGVCSQRSRSPGDGSTAVASAWEVCGRRVGGG